MMKRTISLVLSALFAFSLAGCGAAGSADTASSTAGSAAASEAASSEAASSEAAASSEIADPNAALDYTGVYHNGNDDDVDSVELTKTDDGYYTVAISIYRLCELTGTGSPMDGAVEMELTDPNDNEMTAIFYPEGEYTYAFKVTTSTWEYLPEGTEITGFANIENL